MRLLLANNTGREARRLLAAFPDRIGHLIAPGGWRTPFPTYGVDNGAWPAFKNGRPWAEGPFRRLVERIRAHVAAGGAAPAWVLPPDVVCDADATLASWARWAPELRALGWPLGFVVQNGMTAGDVPTDAAIVCVGGDTDWKRETAAYWCAHFPRVHVLRCTTERWLWHFHRCGVESTDGNVFMGDRSQLDGIWYYLTDSSDLPHDLAHGPMQSRLFALGRPAHVA